MPEPLKNLYTLELVESLSVQIKKRYNRFDKKGFIAHVFNDQWEDKELKDRMRHITESLYLFLPSSYSEAVKILMDVAPMFSGFQYMFFPEFSELYGLESYEESIDALEVFTQHSSSEFAVRPFIIKYGAKMMAQMNSWATSKNYHVRRLASEGCRPRLPWAMALPEFKKDPNPIIPILKRLRQDESDYVRRSVANNLNDISKDNPQVVMDLAKQWVGVHPHTDWVVKHACRTLLKQGNSDIMELFGFSQPTGIHVKQLKANESVDVGGKLEFSFVLESKKNKLGKIRMEYALGFVTKNGHLSRKVFKISESVIENHRKDVTKFHSFKKITTRKYYAGNHELRVIVNGKELASTEFYLNLV